MQLGQFPIRHRLTVALITELRRKGRLLEAAWEKASACSSFWKGVRIVALSRFGAEEIVELAESHASCLERLDEKFRAADCMGITGVKLPDKLSELASILENALNVEPSHLTLVPLAATVEASEALRVFLADCQEFESIEMSVGRVIPGEVTAATLDAVTELERICIEHGIEDLDVDTLGRSVSSKREVIAMARKLATQMRPFADLVPGSEHWRFSDVGKVRELATRAGRNVLHGRSHVTADPAAPELLKKLNEIGRQLQHDRATLSVHFSFAEVTPNEVIADSYAALKNAGTFRALSPHYRRAKRPYRRIAKSKFRRDEAVSQLEQLLAWKTQEAEFGHDMQAAALYGIHFRGIETEFDFFARLVEFYESVHETFATLEQKPLRDFLLLGDAEILSQVPVLDAYPEGVQLKVIEENIGRLEVLAAAREQACNRVRELAIIFNASAKVGTHTLSTLKGAVARCLSERQRLDGDKQISALLGAYFEGSSTNAAALQGLASLAKAIAALGAGGRGVASLIAAGQANAVLKLARELHETFVASESNARKLNGMTGLD